MVDLHFHTMGAAILFANSLPAAVNGLQTVQAVDEDVKSLLCKLDVRRVRVSTAFLLVRRRRQIGAQSYQHKYPLNNDDTDWCQFAQFTACLQKSVAPDREPSYALRHPHIAVPRPFALNFSIFFLRCHFE
jgi:hypothetical protein